MTAPASSKAVVDRDGLDEQARRCGLDCDFHAVLRATRADDSDSIAAAAARLTGAAKTSDHLAEAYLSILHEEGCGTFPADSYDAREYARGALGWLQTESYHHDQWALYCMGCLHAMGIFVELDGDLARSYLSRAEEKGHVGAAQRLAALNDDEGSEFQTAYEEAPESPPGREGAESPLSDDGDNFADDSMDEKPKLATRTPQLFVFHFDGKTHT